jgi:hypothetical protein
MGKYEPLQEYLKNSVQNEITLNFNQIEELLGANLPYSAFKHPAWWANNDTPHVQASAWLNAGWKVDGINQQKRWVRFRRA